MEHPKIALVTGAARRIGRALAIDLARNGWAVAVHYNRSGKDAAKTVETIRRNGGTAVALQADFTDEGGIATLMTQTTDALGAIRCLVNNASVFERDEVGTANRDSWDAHLETNLRAPFVLSQKMAAALPEEAEGVIINMLDQRVWNLTPYFISYTVSKSALWTLTRTLALALAPRIRVNAIGPGPALPSARQTRTQFDDQSESVPLRRGPDLDEICRAAQFIIGANSMTGQMIALDGGQHLGWSTRTDGTVIAE